MADSPLVSFLSQVNSVLEVQGRQPWDFVALFASGADVVCRVGDVLGLPSTEGGGPERRSMVFLLIHRKAMFQAPGAWGSWGVGYWSVEVRIGMPAMSWGFRCSFTGIHRG